MPPTPVRIALGEVSLWSMNVMKDLPLLLVCHCVDAEVSFFDVIETDRRY